jgi:predicted DNA-binding protein YlxM (UPF0122 family)
MSKNNNFFRWLKWGDLSLIASNLEVSRQAVYQVLKGRSSSQRILKELKKQNRLRMEEAIEELQPQD